MHKIMISLMLIALVLSSGCASMLATQYHNRSAERKARVFEGRALSGGEPAIAIDLAAITPGYIAAWGDIPGTMTGATIVDAATAIAAGFAGYQLVKQNGSSGESSGPRINGDNNTTYINSGSGNQTVAPVTTTSTESTTTSGF